MFNILCQRIIESMGVKICSFEDLESIDIDSVDSICISESADSSAKSEYTLNSDDSNLDINQLEDHAKYKVAKILRSIKKLEKLHQKRNESKLPMLTFIDIIRDQQYKHVKMSLLSQFIKICKMIPKTYYLHYYLYFLYYAAFYHYERSTNDIIDANMKPHHRKHLLCIKYQLNYLQYIIKQSRIKEITL